MRRMTGMRAVLLVAWLGGAAVAQEPRGAGPALDEGPVIPAGQEALLAEMLGKEATLPDGCALAEGQVQFAVVTARYTCPGGAVTVELTHPSRAAGAAAETERFAIRVVDGTPPESLVPALAARVREREAGFAWRGTPAGRGVPRWAWLLGGLIAAALLAWGLRRRVARA